MIRLWPYILPLPLDSVDQYRVLLSVFNSKITVDILKCIGPKGKVHQRELLRRLPYSNKTIIEKLKELVAAGILEEGMERSESGRKRSWVKWYKPTLLGRWFALLLTPPGAIEVEELVEVSERLFEMYSEKVSEFCLDFGVELDRYHKMLDCAYAEALLKRARRSAPRVDAAIFGSVAVDLSLRIDKLPSPDEVSVALKLGVEPGGSGANVAVGLRRLGVPTAFCGKVGGDLWGRLSLEALWKEGVEISPVVLDEEAETVQAVVLVGERGEKRVVAVAGKKPALSISSPSEVNWTLVENSRLVYLGEVFVEIAELVASYAKSKGKIVLYRPSTPFLKLKTRELSNVFGHVDVVILNQRGRELLEKEMSLDEVLELGARAVVVTRGPEGALLFERSGSLELSPYEVDVVDTTGCGDAFAAALAKGLLSGMDLAKACKYATAAASLACTKPGARRGLPTEEEVAEFLKKVGVGVV